MKQLIQQGAEGKIYKLGNKLIKHRIKKSYRLEILDNKLRKFRTKREAKLLTKAKTNVPKILKVDEKEMIIEMEFIKGKLLKDTLDTLPKNKQLEVCQQLGQEIKKLHEQDIIHGDLTTSNLILKDDKIYFIDFGLGFFSKRIEDKAVDLHLLKQALESKHHNNYKFYISNILKNYKDKETITRLEKVEKRGRYKNRN